MGHHADPNKYAAYRDAIALRQRIETFALVFSVVVIALIMTFSAVQFRESPCQERAHEISFDTFLDPSATREQVVTALHEILNSRRGSLDIPPQNDDAASVVQLDVLDTGSSFIGSHGFRLVRRSDDSGYRFELRAIFDKLCGSYPTVSMEVMPNVDYETVTYHIKGIATTNGTVKYLQQSALSTKEKNRISTVAQLQTVFPGFHEFGGSALRMSSTHTAKYSLEGVAQVYYNGSPLDLRVAVQCWYTEKDKPQLWRVVASTQNILAENDLFSLQNSLQQGFADRGMLCNTSSSNCGADLDIYLR
ncbi:hypothetical protein ABB37_03554 [Leptomonas pyrrhocoris]|uniref:Uncharacterized protein n=1 Tax=Leptomonas pyrrhocoris TaxID=157538 RepID=A0A0N0DX81_LEPPY|nr:hypothetical protein ABB37_03554 [Leptomonas pyrrhocoris]KPA82502.1 hypothetical protein ABB37_03554 [Leptomonas pyrrhocoris]|eukprot:XP_015660941.1 hypothetical protein ABB37_03554 [Leptomonas pyrrhocoris]